MLSKWGWSLVTVIEQLREAEEEWAPILAREPDAIAPQWTFPQGNALAGSLSKTEIAIRIARDVSTKDQLDLPSTNDQVLRLMRLMIMKGRLSEFLAALKDLRLRLQDDLRRTDLLFIPSDLAAIWNQQDQFGLGDKFKKAQPDIKEAANCLAVGQGTACVFHLMRAMEVAVRDLSRRLHVTITPQTTWRQMTGLMDDKIKKKPETTPRLKRKKNDWEAARANLHHVGSVWRNSTMHPATSYTPRQARDVFDACRVFMNGLCAL